MPKKSKPNNNEAINEDDTLCLFNAKDEKDFTEYNRQLFEQYKIYVDLSDKISQRRVTVNSFFITANAALLTVASWFKDDFGKYMYLISVIGIVVSLFWYFSIRSYKQLNTGKFKVVHEIESRLPLNLFAYEWEVLGKGKLFNTYWPLSHIEQKIPIVFGVLYIALSLFIYFNI